MFTKNLRHSFNVKKIQPIILILIVIIIIAQSEINEAKENN